MNPTFAGMMFEHSYLRSVEKAALPVRAAIAPAPRLVRVNRTLAEELGLDFHALNSDAGVQVFSGNKIPPGAQPAALAYSGHQFGGFSPILGDGRALLLGELHDRSGRRVDLQLKGSGATPFARGGDGRATLGPVLREYLMGEAMAALGIPTTRALAAVTTGEAVLRERPLPGAVLARIAASHLRVGTFEFFAAHGDNAQLQSLVDYAIARHDPELATHPRKALALLAAVGERQARLVAQWMHVGFIHGVMNTDNVAISGETIDYGPCAFMDAYDPRTVFSSIDQNGRYAYGNQPRIAQWNMARLGEALLTLIHDDVETAIAEATNVVQAFSGFYHQNWLAGMRAKLGLPREWEESDPALIDDFLSLLQTHDIDFTLGFRALGPAVTGQVDALTALFSAPSVYEPWLRRWRARLGEAATTATAIAMARVNPAVIPRNHRVEEALAAVVDHDDFQPFDTLLEILAHPFDDQPDATALMGPPPRTEQLAHRTFCGT